VLLTALIMEENIEHAKLRALSQILLDKSKGVEAFEEYMKQAFPYLETQKKRDKGQMLEILRKEIAQGAVGFTPLMPLSAKSKLRSPASVRPAKGRSAEEVKQLWSRLRNPHERSANGQRN
jgi:hypothetical protein